MPYLLDTKIKVTFEGITLNTERQLVAGKLVTTYGKLERNVVDVSDEFKKISENIKALVQQKREQTEAIFGEQGEEYEKELQEWAAEQEKEYLEVINTEEASIAAPIFIQNIENNFFDFLT